MAKGYWVTQYHSVSDPAKLAAYAALAAPALEAAGGVFVVRGVAAYAFEAGVLGRTVVLEFPSVEAAHAAYTSPAYQAALAALGDGATRDVRIAAGV